ncbi:VOC family protein [Streptomyces sp. NBC_01518]|uniref:VOC family protein n=1 Tax=Streptomyces sp. NBC_01518 TaxID=2903891 RepID=UPI00387082F9
MNAAPIVGTPVVRPGHFHRLGIACEPRQHMDAWLRRVLGARPLQVRTRQVHGLPIGTQDGNHWQESGVDIQLLRLGQDPVALFTATAASGPLGRYVARYGPGLHSVAWTIDDLWAAETLLRRRNVRITGADVPGRHFFMHPADTSGLLVEWTDSEFVDDSRGGEPTVDGRPGLVDVRGVAWLTVTVRDARKSAELLASLMEMAPAPGHPVGQHEDSVDLRIGGVTVRLVSPLSGRSRYAEALERHGERLHGVCLVVDELDTALGQLEDEGVTVVERAGPQAWTDPASTLGLPLEWIDRRALPAG